MCGYTTQWQINYPLNSTPSNYLPGTYEAVFNLLLWIPALYVLSSNMVAIARMHTCKMFACVHAVMQSQLLFCPLHHVHKQYYTRTNAHHSIGQHAGLLIICTKYKSVYQSRIMDRNNSSLFAAHENTKLRPPSINTLWGLLWNVSLFPPSYTAARNASLLWYSILTSFNTILIPCLLALFSLDHSLNACLYAEIRWSWIL